MNWKKALCTIKIYIQKWKVLQTLRCKKMMLSHQINGILFILLMPEGVLSKENGNTLLSELLQRCISPLRSARLCCWRSSHLVSSRMKHTETVCVKPLITKVQRAWSWDWPPAVDVLFHYIWTLQRVCTDSIQKSSENTGGILNPSCRVLWMISLFYFVLHSPCDLNKNNPWIITATQNHFPALQSWT